MRNPYHLRASMDRLWRLANSNAPGYRKLKALDTIVRELYAPTEQARQNQDLCFATDPYDVARHHLRDLYDRASPLPPPRGGGRGLVETEGGLPKDEQPPEEDEDPL